MWTLGALLLTNIFIAMLNPRTIYDCVDSEESVQLYLRWVGTMKMNWWACELYVSCSNV